MFHMMIDDRVEEILILDNGSHEITLLDLLKKINKQCKKVRVIFNHENLGVAGGRDLLFREAKGEHIFSFDSDVTILNSDTLINLYLDFVSHEDHWLLGGGGGSHPFFPSIDLRDVVNLPTQAETNKITYLDEVAGWFTAFPSRILKHKGGPIYMDTQFSPFWGEDSDFCYQIKKYGKKCGIVGSGVIAHKWSSCDREDVRKDIYPMWKKLKNKWYNMEEYKDKFKFDFDENFYDENYDKDNEDTDYRKIKLKDVYLNKGMYKGEIGCKRSITDIYPEVNFLSNTKLEYQGQQFETTDFVDDYLVYDKIMQKHFRVVEDKIEKNCDGVYIFTTHEEDEKKTLQVLKKLKTTNIIFNCHDQKLYCKSIDYIKTNFKNYHISTFYNYKNDDLVFLILIKYFNNYQFKTFAKLNPKIKQNSELFDYDLDTLHQRIIYDQGVIDTEDTEKETKDRFNYLGLQRLLTPSQEFVFSRDGLFINYFYKYKVYSYLPQFNNAIENALRLSQDYHNLVNPRISPRHTLRKYCSYLGYMPYEFNTLVVYITNIDSQDDIEKVRHNVNIIKNSGIHNKDIALINGGEIKNFKLSHLGIDYYFMSERVQEKMPMILGIKKFIPQYEKYSNMMFFFKEEKLQTNIDDFMNHITHLNYSICLENMKIDIEMFSILKSFYHLIFDFLNEIYKERQRVGNKINIEATIRSNFVSSFRMSYLWDITKETKEDEECYQFYKVKERMDDEEDYVFNF